MEKGGAIVEEVNPPSGALHIWRWFWELNAARTGGMTGPNSLSFSEIDAWCRLTCIRLDAWELDAIRRMDVAYMNACSDRSKTDHSRKPSEPVMKQATADNIKSVFRMRMRKAKRKDD